MVHTVSLVVVLMVPLVLSAPQGGCPQVYPQCRNQQWHIGADRVRPSGVVVHGHANSPASHGVSGNVHGSHVFGGPHNGAQSVGGGLNFQPGNGLSGNLDATHHKGQGTAYSGSIGGSTQLGPGTLTVGGGAGTAPGSSKVQGQVGATYSGKF